MFNCVTWGGVGATIQPVWGGSTPMAFLSHFSGKVSDMRVYAGKLSDATIQSIYSASSTVYSGPTSFPPIGGTSQVLQVQYSAGQQTFVISPTENVYTVASLGQFSAGFLVQDPTGQTPTPVIGPMAQFSFPTPANLAQWTISIEVLWTSVPVFTPWWHIPYPSGYRPAHAQLLVLITDGEICLYQSLSQISGTDLFTPELNAQGCLTSIPFPLNAWTTYKFTFDSGSGAATLTVGGLSLGAFPGGPFAGDLATGNAILFQVPTQYWLFTQAQLPAGTGLNSGYIRSIDVYSSIV